MNIAKNILQLITNKSVLTGSNYGTAFMAVLAVVIILGAGISGYMAKNVLAFIPWLLALFVFLGGFILISESLTKGMLRKHIEKNGEKARFVANASFGFAPVEGGIAFSELNESMSDVAIALTEAGNVFIRPSIYYEKQPVIKISAESVVGVESSAFEVRHDQVKAGVLPNPDVAVSNRISGSLDRSIPLDKIKVSIKTIDRNYDLFFHSKEKAFADLLLEAFSPAGKNNNL